MKLDLQLSKADFGDDYIPTDTAIKLKTQLALDTKLPPEIKVNYKQTSLIIQQYYLFRKKLKIWTMNWNKLRKNVNQSLRCLIMF